MLGVIFRKAQNKIQDPAKLRRLIVDLIDKEQWSSLSADVKGDAYEGLLQKNAEDVKDGEGQYFTPRPYLGHRRCHAAGADDDDLRSGVRDDGFLLAAYN
jgi:type I restriction enzyme M protein